MVDIQSETTEIRRGKKRIEEETTGQKHNGKYDDVWGMSAEVLG